MKFDGTRWNLKFKLLILWVGLTEIKRFRNNFGGKITVETDIALLESNTDISRMFNWHVVKYRWRNIVLALYPLCGSKLQIIEA